MHDSKLLASTLDSIVVERPEPSTVEQHLCADAGYKGKPCMEATLERGYKPHIRQRREEAEEIKKVAGTKARRWVVERTHSWLNRWRKLLVSFEKTEKSYVALLLLAAALICWRKTIVIYGLDILHIGRRCLWARTKADERSTNQENGAGGESCDRL